MSERLYYRFAVLAVCEYPSLIIMAINIIMKFVFFKLPEFCF